MSTLAVAALVSGVVVLAAIVAGVVVAVHGTRRGYAFAAAVRWSKPAPKRPAKTPAEGGAA